MPAEGGCLGDVPNTGRSCLSEELARSRASSGGSGTEGEQGESLVGCIPPVGVLGAGEVGGDGI